MTPGRRKEIEGMFFYFEDADEPEQNTREWFERTQCRAVDELLAEIDRLNALLSGKEGE